MPRAREDQPPPEITDAPEAQPDAAEALEPLPEPVALAEIEREHIRYAMAYAAGNKSRVARLLQIDRRTLYRKLAQYAAEG